MAAPSADVDSDTFLFTSESVNEVRCITGEQSHQSWLQPLILSGCTMRQCWTGSILFVTYFWQLTVSNGVQGHPDKICDQVQTRAGGLRAKSPHVAAACAFCVQEPF